MAANARGGSSNRGYANFRVLLGEVALFSDAPYSATAQAILVVPVDRLENIIRTKPDLAIAIIRQLARMAAAEDGERLSPSPSAKRGTHSGSPSR